MQCPVHSSHRMHSDGWQFVEFRSFILHLAQSCRMYGTCVLKCWTMKQSVGMTVELLAKFAQSTGTFGPMGLLCL
jgi:hypothetical protein